MENDKNVYSFTQWNTISKSNSCIKYTVYMGGSKDVFGRNLPGKWMYLSYERGKNRMKVKRKNKVDGYDLNF